MARTDPDAGATGGHAAAGRPKRRGGGLWIVLGVLLLLYPVVATLWNDAQLHAAARGYSAAVEEIRPDTRVQALLAEAHAYNARLARSGHHALPAEPGAPGLEEYLATLTAPETHGVLGRLRIPTIAVDLPVEHTTNPDVLYRGVGHMFGTDLPVGGPGTTAVLSAHTGMVDASMFDALPRLREGDEVFVEVLGTTLRYTVTGSQVVGPDDVDAITYEDGVDKLVLITCTPYGINTDRLLVEAVRSTPDTAPEDSGWVPTLSWWMLLDLLVVAAVLLFLARARRRRRSRGGPDAPAV